MEVIEKTVRNLPKYGDKITTTKPRRKKITTTKPRRKKTGQHAHPPITNFQNERNSVRIFNFDEINLAPMERMRTPNYSRCRKFLWALVLTACAAVCIWHLYDRVTDYLSQPTTFEISVDHQQQVQFPAITICPRLIYDYEEHNLTDNLMTAWNETQMLKEIKVFPSCIPSDGICKNYSEASRGYSLSIKNTSIATIEGLCIVLQPDFLLEYRGLYTDLIVDLSNVATYIDAKGKNLSSTFLIHSQGPLFRHDVFYLSKFLNYGYDTTLSITLKKFKYLSRARNPCMSEEALVECRNKCIDKLLEAKADCRLPFMTFSRLPQCNNSKEAREAYDAVVEFYGLFNFSRCSCGKVCAENIFTSSKEEEENSIGLTKLFLQYENNVVETVTERESYSFASLLSDLCASLGFVLGFCIYTFLELLECTFDAVSAHVMKTLKDN